MQRGSGERQPQRLRHKRASQTVPMARQLEHVPTCACLHGTEARQLVAAKGNHWPWQIL